MMAKEGNYHIYIHNEKGSNPSKPTTPRKVSAPAKTGKTTAKAIRVDDGDEKSVPSFVPFSSAINTAIKLGSKYGTAGTIVGVALAVAEVTKVANQTTVKLNNYIASQTGDYTQSMAWSNYATEQHNLFHPISATWNAVLREQEWAKANTRTEQTRTLLGDSAINTLTKGV